MSSGYTCRRCLTALRRSSSFKRPLPRSSISWNRSENVTSMNSKIARSYISTKTRFSSAQADLNKEPYIEPRTPPGFSQTQFATNQQGVLLQQDNLFHPFSKSPIPEIRRRAAYMKQHAYCPHPDHRQTRVPTAPDDPEGRKPATGGAAPAHVRFECPDCGIPVYCCEEHWADDYESHIQICDVLRQTNEDDHDLRSGRLFSEFEYPGEQFEEAPVNLMNWDTFLYTRQFAAINDERRLRQVTKLLTYPASIASVIHELSPYDIRKGGRLTTEGLRSMSGMFSPFIFYYLVMES